jgi:hypothetical protein
MKLADALVKAQQLAGDNIRLKAIVDDPKKYDSTGYRKTSKADVALMLVMALNGYNNREISRSMDSHITYAVVTYHIRKYRTSAVEYDMEKVRALLKSAGIELEGVLGAVKK